MTTQTMAMIHEKRPVTLQQELRPTGFGYTTVYSGENFDKMVAWYQALFKGSVQHVDSELAEDLLLDASHDTVLIIKRPDLIPSPKGMNAGVLHMAWSYSSLAELMYVYKYARDHGIRPDSVLNTGILVQFYYLDPDGNTVELEIDCYDTSEETQTVQRAADGQRPANASHWIYDPDKILAMLAAGVPDSDIFIHDRYHALVASGRF